MNHENMLPVGTMLRGGTYKITKQLSSGGFGNTYMVQNVNFNETYAMKEFFMHGINLREGDTVTVSVPDNKATFESQKAKLKKEAQRLRRLHNAHIVQVHDLFEERGTVYYVMDYIDGESLGSRIQRTGKPLTEAEAMDVLRQMLDALDLVHSQSPQLLHLDIKPANIMMDGSGCAYLIDFGASKQIATDDNNALSTTTGMSYTAGYAPSEQIEQNYERMGPWTDFYALGATLYKLVTMQQPPSPTTINDDGLDAFHFPNTVSEAFYTLIYWLMATSRKNRPQTVAEILKFVKEHFKESPAEPRKEVEITKTEDGDVKKEEIKEDKTEYEEKTKTKDNTEYEKKNSDKYEKMKYEDEERTDNEIEIDIKGERAVSFQSILSSLNWKWLIGTVVILTLSIGLLWNAISRAPSNEDKQLTKEKINKTTATAVEETVKMEDVIAKAKAEGANWDEAQWKASYKDAMKAMKPMFDYMRDMEKKMKEVERGDDAAKAAAVAKIMTESEAKQKEFAPLEKQMDEYQAIINANPIGKKIDNDKAFQEELKKEFNLPEDM